MPAPSSTCGPHSPRRAATTPSNAARAAQVRARIDAARRRRARAIAVARSRRWLSSPRSPCSRRSWPGCAAIRGTDLATPAPVHRAGGSTTKAYGATSSSCPASRARDARPGLGRASHRRGQLGGGLAERHAFGQHIHSHELGPGRELRCEPACQKGSNARCSSMGAEIMWGACDTLPAAAQAHRKDRIRKKASYWSERFNVRRRRAVDDRRARRRRERSAGARPSAEHHVSGGVYADTTIQHRDHED